MHLTDLYRAARLLAETPQGAPLSPQGKYLRHRMVSALTVLNAEDRVTERKNWSYVLLADELRRWSERMEADREELFRRVVFMR